MGRDAMSRTICSFLIVLLLAPSTGITGPDHPDWPIVKHYDQRHLGRSRYRSAGSERERYPSGAGGTCATGRS